MGGYDSALAPHSNAAVMRYVRTLLRFYPPPRSRSQIRREAAGFAREQTQPILDSIVGSAGRRISSGNEAIHQLTGQLTDRLAPLAAEEHASYEHAKGDSAAQRDALAAYLTSHAASVADEAKARTATMGPLPADQQALLDKSTTGVGASAGGAAMARGNIGYDRLNADAATNEAMMRRLPALAALAGVHAGKQLASQTNFQANESLDKVRAGMPGLISGYVDRAERENLARGQAALSLGQGATGQEIQKGIARQSLGLGLARVAQSDTNNRRSTSTTQRGQDLSHADRQAAAAAAKATAQRKSDQKTIPAARTKTQDFAIKLRAGTLGQSGGGSGSVLGGGSAGVSDYGEAFRRVAVFLGNQLGRQLELRLGEKWMRQAVNATLLAAGYKPQQIGNPHTDPSTRGD